MADWVESVSPSFRARFSERDADDAARVVEDLERIRERLTPRFGEAPGDVDVVLHDSEAALSLAQPLLPVLRRAAAPASRRYLAGWYSAHEIHVLAPRLLRARASKVPGSREMLALTPSALYARLAIGRANPGLPPPFRPRALRWAWLSEGAAQWLSGQTTHARPAVARRLREGPRPRFPPNLADAFLLGGTVFDLLAHEEGAPAATALARAELTTPAEVLRDAFAGRAVGRSQDAWHSHLRRVAATG
jgi:hypothetical protein